jgi:hypothetical protein
MIKYFLFLISTSSIMLLNVLKFEDVEITHNIPDYLVSGSTYDVDFTIEKGSVEGFAKFQMDVPDGIEVKSVEVSNSSFTFSDGVVKNIWMMIPTEDEVLLSYKFVVGPNYQGTGTIKAQFVYIKENERYSISMKDHNVTIGDEGGIAMEVSQADANFVPEMVKGHRSVKAISSNEFEVSIMIEKDGLEGFAKIQDELPAGFSAELLLSGESVFSVVGDKIKFIWFNVPSGPELEVKYLLRSAAPMSAGIKLNGTFNFIYKDDARFIDLPVEELLMDERIELLAEEEGSDLIEETAVVSTAAVVDDKDQIDELVVEEQVVEEAVVEEVVPEEEPVLANTSTSIVETPLAQTGIFYRVQIAASKNNAKVTYFKNKFKFRSEIYIENHDGWYKYTTGNYEKYVLARNRREEIKAGYQFRGPFVTAYNAGERITVQEALLISKQKWVK